MQTKHTSVTHDEARRLNYKTSNALIPVAIFLISGEARVTKTTSELFRTVVEKTPHRLMGVYDSYATVEMIADDLAAMGVR